MWKYSECCSRACFLILVEYWCNILLDHPVVFAKQTNFNERHSGRGCVRPKRHWDDGFYCGADQQSCQLLGAFHVVDHGVCTHGRGSCAVPHSHSVCTTWSNRILCRICYWSLRNRLGIGCVIPRPGCLWPRRQVHAT